VADFLQRIRMLLALQPIFERHTRLRATNTSKRPGGVSAHQRFGVVERADERRNGDRIADVAQCDADVAQQPPPLGALDRAVAEALTKTLLVQREQGDQRRTRRLRRPWLELQSLAPDTELSGRAQSALDDRVHGADLLADVAAEDVIADQRSQLD